MPERRYERERTSTIDIIEKYQKLTGNYLETVLSLPDTSCYDRMHKIWRYYSTIVNPLHISEKKYHYLMIKKKWLTQQEYWTNERKISGYGKMGINIPLAIYEYLAGRKNTMNELVLCVAQDSFDYNSVYYATTFEDMERFAKKHYTVHIEPWLDEVIGLPYAIFKRV